MKETHARTPFTDRFPREVRLLELASIVISGSGVAGALYGLYLGIPIPDLNRFVVPTVLVGITLMVAANAWKRRFVRARMSTNPSLQTPPSKQ